MPRDGRQRCRISPAKDRPGSSASSRKLLARAVGVRRGPADRAAPRRAAPLTIDLDATSAQVHGRAKQDAEPVTGRACRAGKRPIPQTIVYKTLMELLAVEQEQASHGSCP